jgi:hypothetical protein
LGGGGGSPNNDSCYGANSSTKHTTRLSVFWTFVPIGCVETLTGPVCIDDGSANGHWNSFSNFRAIVGYDIKRWFTLTFRADGLYASTRDKRAATAESGAGIKEL